VASPDDIFKRSPELLTPVALAYERRLKRFGDTPKGVFWKNAEWQRRRYEILVRIFDDAANEGGVTIHDFGCGYGALFDFLVDHPAMRSSSYIGTDMCKGMVETASERIDDPRALFVRHLTATETADFTFVSGTFNMHMGADTEEWATYVRESLLRLWKRTRRGLAFNLLSISASEKYDGLYYATPEDYLEFAREHMDPSAELIVEPPLPDFTIFARKPSET
jgi:SAM-dependent methyltransferase